MLKNTLHLLPGAPLHHHHPHQHKTLQYIQAITGLPNQINSQVPSNPSKKIQHKHSPSDNPNLIPSIFIQNYSIIIIIIIK